MTRPAADARPPSGSGTRSGNPLDHFWASFLSQKGYLLRFFAEKWGKILDKKDKNKKTVTQQAGACSPGRCEGADCCNSR